MTNRQTFNIVSLVIIIVTLFGYGGYYGRMLFGSPTSPADNQYIAELASSTDSQNSISAKVPEPASDAVHENIKAKTTLFATPVIQTRPNWKILGRLSEQISALKLRFENGDLVAGYILAMNLRYCWDNPLNQHDFDRRIQNEEATNASEALIQRLKSKYEKCQGVTHKQQQQFYHFMRSTAEQGFVPAQENYSQFTPEFFMSSQEHEALPRDQYIAKREQFIAEKLHFLNQAAEHGSLKAIAKLANLYYSQNYGSQGWVKAFAYNQVILAFTDNNALYQRNQWYIEKLMPSLSAQELAQAQARSEKIIHAINQNGTLYSAK